MCTLAAIQSITKADTDDCQPNCKIKVNMVSKPFDPNQAFWSSAFRRISCALILYLFVIANEALLVTSQQYMLQILPSDKSLSKPSNKKFVLTCKGQGGDAALFSQLRWYTPKNEEIHNDSPNLEIKRNFFIFSRDGNVYLHFNNPKPELSGEYRCKGLLQNSEELKSQIHINIYEDVTWDQCPIVQYLIKGNVGERINCKATANPKPSIIWTKGTEQLDSNPRYLINSSGIVIKSPVTDQDGGVFQINALVTETGATHEKRITVQIYSRPQIVTTVDKFKGIEDDQIELKCDASGTPQPYYSWFDGNRRNLSTVGGYAVDRNSGSVIISRLKKNMDEGNFTCIAENYAGKSEKVFQLLVVQRPKIRSFINGSYEQNKESYIECRATGSPLPKLTIRQDGKTRPFQIGDPRIQLNEKIENDERVLLMTYLKTARSDDGLYYCRAENDGGIAEQTGHLEVKYMPDMSLTPQTKVKTWDNRPINISCIADAIPNATIKWFKNGNELLRYPNQNYRIEDSGSGMSRLFITPTTMTYDSNTFGEYRCEGSNSLGKNYIDITLERAVPPGPVHNVHAIEITATRVKFKIANDLYDGGMPVKKIHVEYYNMMDPSERNTKDFPYSKLENVYIIDKLRPFSRYDFRFFAENEVGKGEKGQDISLQTKAESKPDEPEFHNLHYEDETKKEIVSLYPHQFTATWNLPADNGRTIQYFEVKYFPVRLSEFGYEPISEPIIERISLQHDEMTTITLKKLKANTHYRMELRAFNELGFSSPASIIFRTAQSSDPSAEDFDILSDLTVSSIPIGLIAAIAIVCIVIILLIMDIFFYFRYKVGVIYFLRSNICNMDNEDESKLNNFSHVITPTEISSTKAKLRYNGHSVHRQMQVKQTIEMDNPAFDYASTPNFEEENSPILAQGERERFSTSGYRRDHDSEV